MWMSVDTVADRPLGRETGAAICESSEDRRGMAEVPAKLHITAARSRTLKTGYGTQYECPRFTWAALAVHGQPT